jgi:DNA-binding GntR family transcriptional regulator
VPALSAATKRDSIVDQLRRLILSGELERGERLPQDELASRFNSSITPVREALRALEAEGLAVSVPHRGTRVAALDFERVKANYLVRRLVEAYALRRAVTRISARDLRLVRAIVEEIETSTAAGNSELARDANRRFHFFFYDRCGIPALSAQIAQLWATFPWDLALSSPERSTQSSAEHRELLAAVETGDADLAAACVEMHIAHGFAAITRRLGQPDLDPFDVDVD